MKLEGPSIRWTAAELTLLLLLLVGATTLRWWREPQPSAFAGVAGMPDSRGRSDPPSMDETWHLALSTGRGSPYHRYPRDTILRDVPAWTSLRDAPPVWKIWGSLDGIAHPPLYLITLRGWRALFGEDDWTAIRYSSFWSVVAILFTYLSARELLGRATAFWGAATLAVGPVPTYIGLDIRGYSMLVGLASIAIWWLARLQRRGSTWTNTIGLVTTSLACGLTHYFALPACLAVWLYAIAIATPHRRRVVIAGVCAAAFFAAAWGPQMARQVNVSIADTQYQIRAEPRPWQTLLSAAALPWRLIAERPNADNGFALPGAALLSLGAVAAWKRRDLWPFVLWGTAGAGFVLVVDLLRGAEQLRYIRYASVALPLGAVLGPGAAASVWNRRWPVHVLGSAAVALGLWNQPGLLRGEVLTFTPAVQPVLPQVKAGQTILIYKQHAGPDEIATDAMLLEWARMPGVFPRDAAILYGPMSEATRRQLRDRQAWLICVSPAEATSIVPGCRVVSHAECFATTEFYYAQWQTRERLSIDAWLLDLDAPP